MGAAASASQTSTNKANKATAVVPIDTEAEPVVPIDTEAEPVVPIDTEAQAVVSIDTEADRTAAENCADIHQAAREGNVGAVRHFLRVDPGRLESKDFRGRTPLWWAAEKCHVEVVELLLRSDASAEVADDKGWTPLIRAAYHGQVEAVELLLMFGALVAARDSAYGDTARDWAALRGHAAVVEKLILAEAEVSVVLLSGRGCHCASSQDRTVLELKEEAEKKLDVCIEHIIRQNHERLDESQTLAAANVSPGDTLTAVIAAAMLSQPGANSTSPAEDPDLVVKEFGHGICITAEQSFFDEYGPKIEVLESWSELNGVSSLEEVLPAGHVPLSRLLRLSPEGRTFPAPVQVEMPTCAGAQALWRSTARGWEKVDTVTFHDTRALMELDHFCEIVVTGKCRPLKALGFLHPEGENAQVVIMHIGCESCEAGLELLCSDTDVLQHFRRCGPSRQLGMFRHDEDLEIKQADQISRMKIRFHRMPLMSRELDAQSRQHFDVEIEGESHCFKVRPEGACATAATAATTAAAAPAALAATSAEPVSPNSGLEPDAAASAQASSATAPGDMRSAAEAQQGHLLLSGRFNSDTNIAYMKSVKEQLEARHVPVFMVEATVGQSFADLTRIGLGRAKGMVTFCTSEYGAYTGVGYETFHELEFAHDHQLPLFPIRLCEQWPPAPQNNERGIYQNQLVFKNGLVYIDDRQMTNARGVADQIAESVARMGIF